MNRDRVNALDYKYNESAREAGSCDGEARRALVRGSDLRP